MAQAALVTDFPTSAMPANQPVAQVGGVTLMTMIDRAVASGNLDLVERMMVLQERWERNEALKSFNAALAAAKSKIKPITKNRNVSFESKSGGSSTDYWHEDLAAIAEEIDPILGEHQLFYRWRVNNTNGKVVVTCVLSHSMGYSEETTLDADSDRSGNKNAIQGVGSTATYLQRYTLKAALGLSVSNDDDGRNHVAPQQAKRKPPAPDSAQADVDPARPRVIGTEGHKFGTWAAEFVDAVKMATTKEQVAEWERLNAATIETIKTNSPATYDKTTAALQGHLAQIAKGSKRKPPAPGPVPPLATTMPDPKVDFAGFKTWLDGKLAAIEQKDADDYETIWNDSYAPLIDELLMHEQEECIVIYEKHHNRLAP